MKEKEFKIGDPVLLLKKQGQFKKGEYGSVKKVCTHTCGVSFGMGDENFIYVTFEHLKLYSAPKVPNKPRENTDDSKANHFDEGKVRLDLLPGDALYGVCGVLAYGEKKYGRVNWQKGMPFHQLFGSAMRHIWQWFWFREDIDPESGLHHLDHAMCNLMFLREYTIHRKDFDDRPTMGSVNQKL